MSEVAVGVINHAIELIMTRLEPLELFVKTVVSVFVARFRVPLCAEIVCAIFFP
jgi:hypothetical protein